MDKHCAVVVGRARNGNINLWSVVGKDPGKVADACEAFIIRRTISVFNSISYKSGTLKPPSIGLHADVRLQHLSKMSRCRYIQIAVRDYI